MAATASSRHFATKKVQYVIPSWPSSVDAEFMKNRRRTALAIKKNKRDKQIDRPTNSLTNKQNDNLIEQWKPVRTPR